MHVFKGLNTSLMISRISCGYALVCFFKKLLNKVIILLPTTFVSNVHELAHDKILRI